MSFGVQPVRDILADRGITVREATKALGLKGTHFQNTMLGYTAPCNAVREALPKYLGLPLEQLYTPEALAARYFRSRNYQSDKPVRRVRSQMWHGQRVAS